MTDLPELQHLLIEAAASRRRRRRARRRTAAVVAAAALAIALVPRAGGDDVERVADPPVSRTAVEAAYGVFRAPGEDRRDGTRVRRIAGATGARVDLLWRGEELCVTVRDPSGGGACSAAHRYLDGTAPLGSVSVTPKGSLLAFAFPDGVAEVTLTLAGGERVRYPVERNGFAAEVAGQPSRLEWRAPDGSTRRLFLARRRSATDFYAPLTQPGEELDGYPGSRLLAEHADVRAWLVPRRGAVCLVVERGSHRRSGCRRDVADVRHPLIVGMDVIVVAAFPNGMAKVRLTPQDGVGGWNRREHSLILPTRGHARTLHYRDPAGRMRTTAIPAVGNYVLHARAEDPSAIPPP